MTKCTADGMTSNYCYIPLLCYFHSIFKHYDEEIILIFYYLWHQVPSVTTVKLSGIVYSHFDLQRCRWLGLINDWITTMWRECDVPRNIDQVPLQL